MNSPWRFLFCGAIVFIASGCGDSEHSIPRKKLLDPTGIWIMDDTAKMSSALNIDAKQKGQYCLEFDSTHNKAVVQFLFSEKTYVLNAERVDDTHFDVVTPKGKRSVLIRPEPSEPNVYWTFVDSTTFTNGKSSVYDGIKEPNYSSLDDCIAHGEQDYEFVRREQKSDIEGTAEDNAHMSSD